MPGDPHSRQTVIEPEGTPPRRCFKPRVFTRRDPRHGLILELGDYFRKQSRHATALRSSAVKKFVLKTRICSKATDLYSRNKLDPMGVLHLFMQKPQAGKGKKKRGECRKAHTGGNKALEEEHADDTHRVGTPPISTRALCSQGHQEGPRLSLSGVTPFSLKTGRAFPHFLT